MKQKKPILDGQTRWGSSYDMIARLQQLRQFCETMSDAHPEIKLSSLQWERSASLVIALKPAKIASNLFQSEQLTAGDFYAGWLKCKIETEK